MVTLGGLRKPKKDSVNQGWRNESFRGYADYMQTEKFWEALKELMADSRKLSFSPAHPGRIFHPPDPEPAKTGSLAHGTRPFRVAIMCAEAVPWRCHRSLIADALISRGWKVLHIMSKDKADPHRLTPFAKIEDGMVTYPAPADQAEPLQLF